MAAVEIVAQHGWGFGAWCWDGWRNLLPEGFVLHCLDRGYFGQLSAPEAVPLPDIAIVHSLGLHLLPQRILDQAKLIVVLGGFRHFHSQRENLGRRSRRIVEQMLRRLESEPEALLEDFYARCGAAKIDEVRMPVDVERLREDLQLLQQSVLQEALLPCSAEFMVLHGKDDRVVPLERAEDLYRSLSGSALIVFPDAGHALPLTHSHQCWREIELSWRVKHPLQ
jgi:pimeloyl-ACP methyl ester carboxylesterase